MNVDKFNVRGMSPDDMKKINGGVAFFVGVLILAGIAFIGTLTATLLHCNCEETN